MVHFLCAPLPVAHPPFSRAQDVIAPASATNSNIDESARSLPNGTALPRPRSDRTHPRYAWLLRRGATPSTESKPIFGYNRHRGRTESIQIV